MGTNQSILEAKARDGAGKGAARKLRATGLIPAVIYGRHMEKPAHVAVHPDAIRTAIATPHKLNTLITVKLDGAEYRVMLKDFQQDPVSHEVLHADFVEIRGNDPVKVKVPLVLTGKAEGEAVGGILQQTRRELEVMARPDAIPEKIEADVSHLKIAQALHINDIKLPEGVQVKTTVNFTLAVVAIPEKEEVAPTPAAVPGEEGAVPAEGAAAAAPGAPGAPAAPGAPGAPAAAGAAPAAPEKGGKGKGREKK